MMCSPHVFRDVTLLLIRYIFKAALAADVLAQNLASVEEVVEVWQLVKISFLAGSNVLLRSLQEIIHAVRRTLLGA